MIRRPPRSTRTDTLFPYTTLFRSLQRDPTGAGGVQAVADLVADQAFAERTHRLDRRVRLKVDGAEIQVVQPHLLAGPHIRVDVVERAGGGHRGERRHVLERHRPTVHPDSRTPGFAAHPPKTAK